MESLDSLYLVYDACAGIIFIGVGCGAYNFR